MGENELKALVSLIGSPLFYTLAFLVFILGFKKAILDQDTKGWFLIGVSSLMAAFPAIFDTTRAVGYAVMAPLEPGTNKGGVRDNMGGSGGGGNGGGANSAGAEQMQQSVPYGGGAY